MARAARRQGGSQSRKGHAKGARSAQLEQLNLHVLSPLRKLAKITAENVNQPHRYKVGHEVLLFHRCVSNMDFLVLFLWFWFIFL